jgi:hypothetical protein
MKALYTLFLLLSVLGESKAQSREFIATRMGTSYETNMGGWYQETTYPSVVHMKIVIEPFLLTIDNIRKDRYNLKQMTNRWEGLDVESKKHFIADRYNALDYYNRWAVVTIYRWDDTKTVVQVQYADCTYYYSDIFN